MIDNKSNDLNNKAIGDANVLYKISKLTKTANFKLNKKEKNLKKEFNNLAKAFLEIKILKIKKNKKLRRSR